MFINGFNCVSGANLRGANLRGANLRDVDLRGANLRGANLRDVDLSGANLSAVDLSGANLRDVDLSGANLSGANLRDVDLRGANLSGANLRDVDLSGANLSGANLSGANLRDVDLRGVDLYGANLYGAKNVPSLPWTIIVPEGTLIVYKQVSNGIAKLRIPEHALRLNGTSRKCRASEAYVLECPDEATSLHDVSFAYKVGTIIKPTEPFCEDRWNECSSGIYFFLTREEAAAY